MSIILFNETHLVPAEAKMSEPQTHKKQYVGPFFKKSVKL